MLESELLAKYKASLDDLQEELQRERKLRFSAECENRQFRKKVLSLEEALAEVKYSGLYSSVLVQQDLSQQVSDLHCELDEAYQLIKDKDSRIDRLERGSRTDEKDRQIQQLQKELSACKKDAEHSFRELSHKEHAIQEWANTIGVVEEKLKELTVENDYLRKDCTQYQKDYEAAVTDVALMREEIERATQENAELQRSIADWDKQAQRLRQDHEFAAQRLEQDVQAYKQSYEEQCKLNKTLSLANEALTQEKEALKQTVAQLREDLSELHDRHYNLKCQKTDLETLLNTQVREIESSFALNDSKYKDLLSQKEKSINHLETQLDAASTKLEHTQSQLAAMKNKEDTCKQQLQQLHSKLEHKTSQVHSLQQELDHALATVKEETRSSRDAQAQLHRKMQQEREDLLQQLSTAQLQLEQEVARHEQTCESYQRSNLQLKEHYTEELLEKEDEVHLLNEDRKKLQDMMSELQDQLTHMRAALAAESVEDPKYQQELEEENQFLLSKVTELEHKVEEELEYYKGLAEESTKQLGSSKSSKKDDRLNAVQERVNEELGYLSRWKRSLADDPEQADNYERLDGLINRLLALLDFS